MRAQHKNILRHLRRQIRNTNLTHGQKLRFYKCVCVRERERERVREEACPNLQKAGTTIYKR